MADATQHPCDEGVIRGRAADAPCEENARPWILAATILGSSMVFIGGSTVNVALPALQRGLGATVVDIQWVLNAYLLLLASLILLGGSLGDHYGRKRVFMLGVALFTAASVWCGLAPSAGQLIAARAVQGVGGALLTPGSLAIISASFGEGERGRAIGLWSGFSAITSALGPVLGGWLIDTLSWRWIFFLNVPLGRPRPRHLLLARAREPRRGGDGRARLVGRGAGEPRAGRPHLRSHRVLPTAASARRRCWGRSWAARSCSWCFCSLRRGGARRWCLWRSFARAPSPARTA